MKKSNSKKIIYKAKKGFTLIETLIAVSILVVAIVGPLSVAYQGVFLGSNARDQLIASYLAQDAIEYIRYRITTNSNSGLEGIDIVTDATKGRLDCDTENNGRVCWIDSLNGSEGICSGGECDDLTWNTLAGDRGYYTHSVGETTNFNREVRMYWHTNSGPANNDLGGGTEYRVEVTVRWGKEKERSLTVMENFIDWRVIFQ
ncbi:MAG: prepilin-type N-terminal cleavage/methylation domain-containing protein [Candidatus Pacebacteria bacterium]|nr:prepilin-type N-terminal cleavage/methylation domain-containing protein [Candidatus Paceibacterota bacterium]